MITAITDQDFEQETDDGLVITDFWATWCGPCKMQAPVMDKLAEQYDDVKFTKMDVDANPKVPEKFGIRAIPTMILKKNGQVVETLVGYQSEDQLKKAIEKHS
ncbi:thioredoxin [Bombilactobacillus thymidiniphilus]|uniref:Thioredoxin n=1 Tax=Bombilactobacillus thymidiniphilus TaxID=2923363 RepID=A0ABY4PDP0_9LACO|nr:thioredoxin [Bombilactobacillus thymidiniphilus]UQS83893.1 thioredoxin [Bombilactobacillus thymidiniphilus]